MEVLLWLKSSGLLVQRKIANGKFFRADFSPSTASTSSTLRWTGFETCSSLRPSPGSCWPRSSGRERSTLWTTSTGLWDAWFSHSRFELELLPLFVKSQIALIYWILWTRLQQLVGGSMQPVAFVSEVFLPSKTAYRWSVITSAVLRYDKV